MEALAGCAAFGVCLCSGDYGGGVAVCIRFFLSKASENRFFGTIYFDYNSRAGWDSIG